MLLLDDCGAEFKSLFSGHLGSDSGYSRGDPMIWDFVGRRPLPVRDYVVSIKDGPKL